jgi:hypothetical protein
MENTPGKEESRMSEVASLEDENRTVAQIKRIVDQAAGQITNGDVGYQEALALAQSVRAQVQQIVPDKMDTYDLIYAARFRRLIEQFVQQDA